MPATESERAMVDVYADLTSLPKNADVAYSPMRRPNAHQTKNAKEAGKRRTRELLISAQSRKDVSVVAEGKDEDSGHEERETKKARSEADVADSRLRFEAERLLNFYDEIANPKVSCLVLSCVAMMYDVCRKIPEIVQAFLKFERACSEVVLRALDITSRSTPVEYDCREFDSIMDRTGTCSEMQITLI